MPLDLARLVVDVPDFPTPGVRFADLTPLLASPAGLSGAVEALVRAAPRDVDAVLGVEARGFLLAAPVALSLGVGVVPVRKPGKLPRAVEQVDYALEYGTGTLAVHADAVVPGTRVLLVDDVLATGGTLAAAAQLVARLGGRVAQVAVLVELAGLGGRERLAAEGLDVATVLVRDAG